MLTTPFSLVFFLLLTLSLLLSYMFFEIVGFVCVFVSVVAECVVIERVHLSSLSLVI